MICGNGPCGRSSAFAWRQSRHCCRGPLFTIRKPARPALRLGQAGTLQQHPGRAAPPLYPRYETAFRGRQLSLTSGASAQLPAVRPTAAQSRGARPQRPGSWGLQAAPYAPPLRGRAPPLPPLAVRPAQTTAALQENNVRAATAPLRPFNEGNARNRARPAGRKRQYGGEFREARNRATRSFGSPRAALPGRPARPWVASARGAGPARRRSLAGRIAAARPAIGGAVRSAQGAGRRENDLYDNQIVYRKLPFPRHIASPCARSVPEIF